MKFWKIAAAAVCCMGISTAASAATSECVYNDEKILINCEIAEGRTLVDAAELAKFGVGAEDEGATVLFTKDSGRSVRYSKDSGSILEAGSEFDEIAIPDDIPDGYFPLRAVLQGLDISVGWDETARNIVAVDYIGFFNSLENTMPNIYKFLMQEIKQPESGTETMDMSFEMSVPVSDTESFEMTILLNGTGGVLDGKSKSNITLSKLFFKSGEQDFELTDVSFEGIYDMENSAMYFKTNAIERLKETVPAEYRTEIDAVAELFSENSWYCITLEEYISYIAKITGLPEEEMKNSLELAEMLQNGGAVSFGEIFRNSLDQPNVIDSIFAFDGIKYIVTGMEAMEKSNMMTLEFGDDNSCSMTVSVTPEKIRDMMKNLGEEDASADAFEGFLMDFRMRIQDSVVEEAAFDMQVDVQGFNMDMSVNTGFDPAQTPEKIEVPESSVSLIQIIESAGTLMGATMTEGEV